MSILRQLGDQSLRRFLMRPRVLTRFTTNRFKNVEIEKITSPKFPDHHFDRNECLKRPLSPHVTIYKMEFHMLNSLLHRTSGILLSTYFLVFGVGTLLLPNDLEHYIDWVKDQDFPQALIFGTKWIIALPFVWHSVGGIRHLIWDVGLALRTMQSVWVLGAVSFIAALAITTALALIET